MFIPKYPLLGPDDDIGGGSGIDDTPADDIVDNDQDTQLEAPSDTPSDTPSKSAEDAVREVLKAADAPADDGKPPAAKPADTQQQANTPLPKDAQQGQPGQPAQPNADAARLEEIYQIPPGLKGEERARFKRLSDHARGLDTEVQKVRTEYEQTNSKLTGFREILEDAHASPEVLNQHLRYIKACATGDLETAFEFAKAEYETLARHMGRPVDGVDVLGDFPELRQAVDDMEMTEQHAIELAKHRRAQAQHQQQQQQDHASQQQRQAIEREQATRTKAMTDIKTWTEQMSRESLDWDRLEPAIVRYIQGAQQTLRNLPPDQWLANIKAHYDALTSMAAASPPPGAGTPRPLRPQGAGGRVEGTPTSAEDAVKQRLGYRR